MKEHDFDMDGGFDGSDATEHERAMAEYEYYAQAFHPEIDARALGLDQEDPVGHIQEFFDKAQENQSKAAAYTGIISEAALPSVNAEAIVQNRTDANHFSYSNFVRDISDKWLADRLEEYDSLRNNGMDGKALMLGDDIMSETFAAESMIENGGMAVTGYLPVRENGAPVHARVYSDEMYKKLYDYGIDTRKDSLVPVFDKNSSIYMSPADIVAQTRSVGAVWGSHQQEGVELWVRDAADVPFPEADVINKALTDAQQALLNAPEINPAGVDLMSEGLADYVEKNGFMNNKTEEEMLAETQRILSGKQDLSRYRETQHILSGKQGLPDCRDTDVVFDATKHPEEIREKQPVAESQRVVVHEKAVTEVKQELNERYGAGRMVDDSLIRGNESDSNEYAK